MTEVLTSLCCNILTLLLIGYLIYLISTTIYNVVKGSFGSKELETESTNGGPPGDPAIPFAHRLPIEDCRRDAEQGDAEAQYNLGCRYANGNGVAKDYVEAVKWYRKAAEQGNADAQYNLGTCYDYGTGVAKDEVEAVKWYRKAARSYKRR